jgi:hypothetical protein
VLSGGGRIGSRLDGLGFGLQGGGYKAKGDWGADKDFSVDPYFDARYNGFGLNYSPDRMGASYEDENNSANIDYSPANKLLQLMYSRRF